MNSSDRFFGICNYGTTPAPPEIPSIRQGFNNLLLDSDGLHRRNLLAVESPEPCQNFFAFSLQLVRRHLAVTKTDIHFNPKNANGYIQFGSVQLKTLAQQVGGYHHLDNRGHQILINYRSTNQIAESVSLTEFLEQYSSHKVGKRIVIIGTTAPSFNDHRWDTPLGTMTGLEVLAHQVSHLLSTVEENRPIIWSLPRSVDALVIGMSSFIGGAIIGLCRTRFQGLIFSGSTIFLVSIIGWGLCSGF